MSAHDDLRRQLLGSVSDRRSTAAGSARLGPRRLRGRRRSGLAIAVLSLAVGGGVAGAATQLLGEPGTRERARSLVQQAVTQSSVRASCQAAVVTFVDTEPVAALRALFGSSPARVAPQVRALVRREARGEVLSRTIRLVPAGGGRRLLAYVSASRDPFTVADRAGCHRAQRSRLLALHPADDAVRRLARRLLADEQRQRLPHGQMLYLSLLGERGTAGAAAGISDGGRGVPTGVILGSTSLGYAGISVARATTVRVSTKNPHSRRWLRRTYPVRERFFAFTLPRRTGPVEVRQLAADGRTLAVQTLRARTRPKR
jgi:hypothetical protein